MNYQEPSYYNAIVWDVWGHDKQHASIFSDWIIFRKRSFGTIPRAIKCQTLKWKPGLGSAVLREVWFFRFRRDETILWLKYLFGKDWQNSQSLPLSGVIKVVLNPFANVLGESKKKKFKKNLPWFLMNTDWMFTPLWWTRVEVQQWKSRVKPESPTHSALCRFLKRPPNQTHSTQTDCLQSRSWTGVLTTPLCASSKVHFSKTSWEIS